MIRKSGILTLPYISALVKTAVIGLMFLVLAFGLIIRSPNEPPVPKGTAAAPMPAWAVARLNSALLAPQGAVYYVATTGNNANPGTLEKPWRTIQKAARTLTAGDTVYVRAGTYHERVRPRASGAAGAYITYTAYPGETVTIDGTGVTVPDYGGLFDILGVSYIRVSNLRVVNSSSAGILIDEASYIAIENNYTYNTVSSGIGVWNSEHVIIDGNEVELANNDGGQENITVGNTDNFEVRHNHVHHGGPGTNGGLGIDVKDGSSDGKVYGNHVHHLERVGIYVDAWDKHTHDIEVFQNVVHDIDANGFGLASEAGGLLEDVHIYNNIAYHNTMDGLNISACCSDLALEHPMHDIVIVNNTFYENGSEDWGGGISVENPYVQDFVIRNNIVSQNLVYQIQVELDVPMAKLTVDHNLIDGYRGYEDTEIYGDDYVEGAAQFVDAASADFHLEQGSPAIDSGSSTSAPDDDFDGNARPQDGDQDGTPAWDMGAYEFLSFTPPTSTPTPTPTATSTMTPTPTPTATPTSTALLPATTPSVYIPLVIR